MEGLDQEKYINRYQELMQLVPHMVPNERKKVERFIAGLIPEIRSHVAANRPPTLQEAITLVNILTHEQKTIKGIKDDCKKRSNDQASGSSKNRKGKKQRTAKNFVVTTAAPEGRVYAGVHPK